MNTKSGDVIIFIYHITNTRNIILFSFIYPLDKTTACMVTLIMKEIKTLNFYYFNEKKNWELCRAFAKRVVNGETWYLIERNDASIEEINSCFLYKELE